MEGLEKYLQNRKLILEHAFNMLKQELSVFPMFGAELEFYINEDTQLPSSPHYEIVPEKGQDQYEAQFDKCADVLVLAGRLSDFHDQINANFSSKPFASQPGSALHFHISLYDERGNNLFAKNGQEESGLLLHAVAGVCEYLPESMIFFAPDEAAYSRFVAGDNAPTHICWGGNNRSVAVRLPTALPIDRRIEHRVSGADADPYLAFAAIIFAIYSGISQKLVAPPRIYGNAYLPQYQLPEIAANFAQAMQGFESSGKVKACFESVGV